MHVALCNPLSRQTRDRPVLFLGAIDVPPSGSQVAVGSALFGHIGKLTLCVSTLLISIESRSQHKLDGKQPPPPPLHSHVLLINSSTHVFFLFLDLIAVCAGDGKLFLFCHIQLNVFHKLSAIPLD